MSIEQLTGSIVALVTPFHHNEVDENALRTLVRWHTEQGTNALVVVGTTGESATLTEAEHKQVIAIAVEEAAGRIPIIAGAGSNNPVEAVRFAQAAQEIGANAILCAAGYYNRPSQQGLFEHFKHIHDDCLLPMLIYNIPPRVVVDIEPTTMARLAQLPRIIGVKDATCDLSRISIERQGINDSFKYYSGDDMTALAYRALGGHGCISVTANIVPALSAKMHQASSEGDFKTALEIHQQLVPLHQALFIEPSPAGVKYALSLLGRCSSQARLPMVTVQPDTASAIEQAMLNLELI